MYPYHRVVKRIQTGSDKTQTGADKPAVCDDSPASTQRCVADEIERPDLIKMRAMMQPAR